MGRTATGFFAVVLGACSVLGCSREAPEQFTESARVAAFAPNIRLNVLSALETHCGTPDAPKLLNDPKADSKRLAHGAKVYRQYCRQCHGTTGDGNGPVAKYLLPRPRDYRPGVFKFTSTTFGAKPLREDLERTIQRGIAGTSMPSFRLLPKKDLDAVVDYVLALTYRGELESMLATIVEEEGNLAPKQVPEAIKEILGPWNEARSLVVYPVTPMPQITDSLLNEGRAIFQSSLCVSCHGPDGRGQMKENIGTDYWGRPTQAADLTSGMLRGGTDPLDVYRHIHSGINGTPMPSFGQTFAQEPDKIWKLTAFVLDLANGRRSGKIPEAGLLKPLPGVEADKQVQASGDRQVAVERIQR